MSTPSLAHVRWHGFLFLAITSIGWALNWPAIKILLREWPPLFSRGVAGVAAAVILAVIALARRESLKVPRGSGAALLFASFTNVFAWMGFGTMAMKHLSISEAALLVYTMPIWAMLFAWPLRGARPTLRDVASVVLGVLGMAILFGGHGFAFGADKLAGMALALASAMLFALGSVMARGPLPMPPVSAVAWQAGLGCLPMVILGWIFERPDMGALSALGFADLVYMALVPMGVCYLAWFAALKRLPASTAAMGTLTVPIMGVAAGAIVLGDPLGWRVIAAGALTLPGVALALQSKRTGSASS
jgi:drug/metabolite transporter (DMT)-like permease